MVKENQRCRATVETEGNVHWHSIWHSLLRAYEWRVAVLCFGKEKRKPTPLELCDQYIKD